MPTRPTISIGIPAHNEEYNIKNLLEQILTQTISNGVITEIIVASDGSTDNTVALVSSFSDNRIRVIDQKERRGQLNVQNDILKQVTGDILVLFNADTLLADTFVVDKLVQPFLLNPNIGLVGGNTIPLPPENFFESVLVESHLFKTKMYEKINGQQNIYLCHGRVRAFSRNFYTKLTWLPGYPEDSFSYLRCIQEGCTFTYEPKAKIFFRSPSHFRDHLKQTQRFTSGNMALEKYFGREVVKTAFKIPLVLLVKELLMAFIRHPIKIASYCLLMAYIRILPKQYTNQGAWEESSSTKRL